MTDLSRPIYLDHNASTPLLPEVLEAMLPYLTDRFGNPSSEHAYGRLLRSGVVKAREQVAALISSDPVEIFFTSGGTEANNLAIRGVAAASDTRRQIVTSMIEHPATSAPCAWLENQGFRVDRAKVDGNGAVRLPDIRRFIGHQTLLVTVMHANSETGTLQPIREIARHAHDAGALVHTDAAQSIGKLPVSVQHENVDLLSIAGHKLYAPQGVGVLFVRSGTAIAPLLLGAGHENGLRPGTENVAAIVGLGAACETAQRSLTEESVRIRELRNHFWGRLRQQIPDIRLNGHPENRLPNTLSVRFPGVSGNELLNACPEIAASTGSACHESGTSASDVILAMGVAPDEAIGTVRLTLGRSNDRQQIDRAADTLARAWVSMSEGG
ncbi:MAG: cysteine desulfurase [Xanthomonadales bacterium]|nr:cysteine desulfurase [Gammaproteobacteria bacterium]MBT8052952.1 cysteine desulfurase [Gammaproteobacteria bacterium]NND57844.1 cysteine desulfurase [Xanthomonadales bacterium]NNK50724.1 cysteine desulfurase [Xanthomonadales bacterium]